MASEESETEGKPNGNYINSFVSFLKGSSKKDKINEAQSEKFVSGTGNANDKTVDRMEEEEATVEPTRSPFNSNESDQETGQKSVTPDQETTKTSVTSDQEPIKNSVELDQESTKTSVAPSQGIDDKDKDSNNTTAINEEIKDSDFNYNSGNDSSRSSSVSGVSKNVAKRGRKRKHADVNSEMALSAQHRRAARNVKCYVDEDVLNDIDEMRSSDPDYNFSDSDDDPDFDPSKKRNFPVSPNSRCERPREAEGVEAGREVREYQTQRTVTQEQNGKERVGRSSGQQRLRQSVDSTDDDSSSTPRAPDSNEETLNTISQKRRGRPPVYQSATPTSPPPAAPPSEEISDNTVSSTDDATKTSGKLSSAYNYATTRTRQNQAIRLPEGPNLTEEQLKLIESQFKSGDFVMGKKDTDMMENPPIWRIDGKSLLQKFQAFEKDGKMLYRNISTYSGWTAQAKALYVPVKVNFVYQSRYDTVVELIGFKGLPGTGSAGAEPALPVDKPVWLPKNKDFEITEELRTHMPSFEIYLQTLISQALDNNFLSEIYEENDSYFVDRVKVIDEMTEQRKAKILLMSKWDKKFQTSLDTWPCVNTMITKNTDKCQACGLHDVTMLSQFYGQPYDHKTLRSKEPSIWDLDHKNFETCGSCSSLSQLYNKVSHQKYDFYSQCKSTVTNMRVSQPNKSTTNVLRDLLANDEWITGLFRSMCTTWIKVDNFFADRNSPSSSSQAERKAMCLEGVSAREDDPDDPCEMEGDENSSLGEGKRADT